MSDRPPNACLRILVSEWIQLSFQLLQSLQQSLFDCEQRHQRRHLATGDDLQLPVRQLTKLHQHFALLLDELCQTIRVVIHAVYAYFLKRCQPIQQVSPLLAIVASRLPEVGVGTDPIQHDLRLFERATRLGWSVLPSMAIRDLHIRL